MKMCIICLGDFEPEARNQRTCGQRCRMLNQERHAKEYVKRKKARQIERVAEKL